MSVAVANFKKALCPPLPEEIVDHLLNEYRGIKQSLVLAKYSPAELDGGRFAECILRLIQHLHAPPYTPFGQHLEDANGIVRKVESNTTLPDSIRFYIPRLARVLLDVRNRRNVAHVGGDVDPNYADSLLVSQVSDWILTELVRTYFDCPISEARKVVESINQVHVPVIFEVNGFLKVQNSSLIARDKVLVLLYYRKPEGATDAELMKWTSYKSGTRFRDGILTELDNEALIHYRGGNCLLTPKGVNYVERNLSLEIVT